jgi:hypothetical protein
MVRPQFFHAVLGDSFCCDSYDRLFRRLFVLDLPIALRSSVSLLDVRVCYAPILLLPLCVGVIHKDEFEHFAQLLLLDYLAIAVLCAER